MVLHHGNCCGCLRFVFAHCFQEQLAEFVSPIVHDGGSVSFDLLKL